MTATSFLENGVPIPFADAVTSGLSVGVPGTPATWEPGAGQLGDHVAVRRPRGPDRRWPATASWSTRPSATRPRANEARFRDITSTRGCSCPGGAPAGRRVGLPQPRPGPHLRRSRGAASTGSTTARWAPQVVEHRAGAAASTGSHLHARPGLMQRATCGLRRARSRADPRRLPGPRVYGMAPPSSGGSTVGEALNILEERLRPVGDRPHPGDCTTTSRRARWPSPTATATWATRPRWMYRLGELLSDSRSRPSGPARSTRRRRRTSRCRGCPRRRLTTLTAPGTERHHADRRRPGRPVDDAPDGGRQVGQRRAATR